MAWAGPRLVVRDTRGWGDSQAGDIRFYTLRYLRERLVIHNASRPRRPHLWIRVLVCPWEAFAKQGEYEPGSIGIWSQLISIGPKCYQNGTRIQPKYHANHTLGHPRAGSERQVAKRRRVGSKWGAHGSEYGFPTRCFWHQVLSN